MDVKLPPHTTQKKILYVITKSTWGGAQRYVYDLAEAVQKRGFDVLVAAGGDGELSARLRKKGITVANIEAYQRDINVFSECRAFLELYHIIKRERPDVVHANSSKAGLALFAGFLLGVPKRVFTVHGWAWNEVRPVHQKVVMWIAYYATVFFSTSVVLVSHAAHDQAHFPFLSRKMHVIWNGIHSFPMLSKEEARRRLLPKGRDGFWVGVISELHPVKGLPIVIEAYEHFVPDVPQSELVIIGEGEMRAKLERQITIEGVAKNSYLLGRLENASSYLKAFDVFVLGSRSEGLPYVLLEAGVAGLPVIATNVGGIPEIVEDEKTGLLVPYGDRQAMTDALLRMAQHQNERERYAQNLYEKVCADFSSERMVSNTLVFY